MPDRVPNRIVVIDTGYGEYEHERSVLEEAGFCLEIAEGTQTAEEKSAFAQGASGILVRGTIVDGDFLDSLPGLKSVVRYGVGYDNVDVEAATDRGIRVANVQGYANHSVSDHALGLILACLRGLNQGCQMVRGKYGVLPHTPMAAFKDTTLGIIGLGNIGGTLSDKASHLFQQVIAYDPYKPESWFRDHGAARVDFDTLLRESDVISIHCDLNAETAEMIDTETFVRMARKPVIVNTARGAIIDEKALLVALKEDRVSAAGLDVFSEEPPGPGYRELLDHPRVLATGHYAWYTEEADRALRRGAAHNMVALLRGEIPADCLNP